MVRGGSFPAYSSRAGSLETCGFKQTFWSLLGLRPKVTRARSAEYFRRRERSKRRRWRIQRGERVAAVKISSARRQAAQKFRAPQQCSFSNINRAAGPYGVRLSGCAGIRETADMDATVPLHDNRPARLRAVRGSGSDMRSTRDSLYDDQHIFWSSRGTRRRFMTRSAAQEVLKPAVSSRPFGHFWGCGQK